MAEQAGPKSAVIALTMDKNGVPQDTDSRVAIAAEIVQKAMERGFDTQRIFVDPIILPVKVPNAQSQPGNMLAAIDQIKYLINFLKLKNKSHSFSAKRAFMQNPAASRATSVLSNQRPEDSS